AANRLAAGGGRSLRRHAAEGRMLVCIERRGAMAITMSAGVGPVERGEAEAGSAASRRHRDMKRKRSRVIRERLIEALLFLAASVSVLTTAGIVYVLVSESVEFFRHVPLWDFLTD